MANNFEFFFQKVLKDEGTKFEDVPGDRGGPTCCGITIADVARWNGVKLPERGENGWDDLTAKVAAINPTSAAAIYKKFYWDTVRADELPSGVDYAVADFAVNSGPGKAVPTLGSLVGVTGHAVTDQMIDAVRTYGKIPDLINHFQDIRRDYLIEISTPPHYAHNVKFRNGWLEREARVRKLCLTLASKADDEDVQVKLPKALPTPAAEPLPGPSKVAVAVKSRSAWASLVSAGALVLSNFHAAADYVGGILASTVDALPNIVSDSKANVQAFTDLGQTVGAADHVAKAAAVIGIIAALIALFRHVDFKHATLNKQP